MSELALAIAQRLGYPRPHAERVAERIAALPPDLMADFEAFWEDGTIGASSASGYTIVGLMTDFAMSPIAAILTIDWLRRDPLRAKALLGQGVETIAYAGDRHPGYG